MSAIPTEVEEFGAAIAEVVTIVSREHAARPSLGADRTEPPAIAEALARFVEVAQRADAGLSGGATRFFREGMGQMEALNYPPHVRAVMERYFQAWSNRTVH